MTTFKDYLNEKLPNYEEVLDDETMAELKAIWDSAQKSMRSADYCLEMQFKGTAGIDYTNDFEKHNAESSRKMAELNNRIEELRAVKTQDIPESSFRL